MKGLFSLKLYLEGLKRIKIAGIAAAIAVILLNATVPAIALLDNRGWFLYNNQTVTSVTPFGFLPVGMLMLLFGAVFAYSMFSFLNERNRSDFFHAIPYKRICVYLSFVAAIVTWIFGILTVSAGVNAVLYGFAKYYTVNFSVMVITPLVFGLASTMIAAFMTLAMTLTGTTVSNVLIFLLVLLFGRTIGQLFVTCLREITPVVAHGESFLNYMEFGFSLPFQLLIGEGFDKTPLILYTVLVTVVVFAAAAVCYVKRKSEAATKSAPSKLLQHVYRSAISLPFFLLIVFFLIVEGLDLSLQFFLIVLALLVYCLFELMTTKKIKSLVKALPMLVIPILLSGVFTGAVYMTRHAILNQIPDLEEIESVGKRDSVGYDPDYQELRINDATVDSEEAKELVLNALKRDVDQIRKYGTTGGVIFDEDGAFQADVYTRMTVQIRLKNGRTLGRYIRLSKKEYERLSTLFLESYDYLEAYLDLPTSQEIDSINVSGYDFAKSDVKRLWASFLLEYSELSQTDKLSYVEKSYYNEEIARFFVSGTYRLETFHSNYPILYEYMPETSKMYLEIASREGILQSDMTTLKIMAEQLSKQSENENIENHFSIVATLLSGENAGEEYYVESVKTENAIPRAKAVEMLEFFVEHGDFSYDSDDLIVRFTVQLYDVYLYDFNPDSYTPEDVIYSSLSYSEVAAESGEIMSTRVILSLADEEWTAFKTLIEPYCYK